MSRAILIKALCAILLLTAAPATSTAQEGGDAGGDRPQWARVRLQFANGDRLTPAGILLNLSGVPGFGPDGARFLGLGDAVETRDENKLDLGGLFGALGVGQETTSSEFEDAERFGDVFVIGEFLVVDPLPGIDGAALARTVKTTVVANQGVSFVIGGLFGPVEAQEGKVPALGEIPLLGGMFRSRVGDAHVKGGKLLILVTPHLIDLD